MISQFERKLPKKKKVNSSLDFLSEFEYKYHRLKFRHSSLRRLFLPTLPFFLRLVSSMLQELVDLWDYCTKREKQRMNNVSLVAKNEFAV